MRCLGCSQETEPQPVGFTWWGGAIGARLLSHVQCPQCGARFNGKTGKSNDTAIAIYMIVVGVLAFAVFYAIRN
jgi:hypothetical protein